MNALHKTVRGILLLAAALAPAAAVSLVEGTILSEGAQGPGPSSFFVVQRGPMAVRFEMDGTIKSKNAVKILPGIHRRIKIVYKVPEGTRVKKGDLLVRLEIPGIEEEIRKVEIELATHVHQYARQRVEYEIAKDETKVKVDKARIARDEAVQGKKRYEDHEAPLEHKRLTVCVDQARTRLDRAKKNAVRLKAYLEDGFSTRDEVIQGALEVKRAGQALEKARADLDLYLRFTRPMNLARQSNGLRNAESALSAAIKRQEVKRKGMELGLFQKKKSVLRVKKRYDELRGYLEKTVLKAPCDGIAMHGIMRERRGMVVYRSGSQGAIISLLASREVIVGVRVPEEKIYLIEKGMKARVRMDSAGLATTEGVVTKVAELPSARDYRRGTRIKEFEVEISIDAGGRFLRPNSNVQVEIEVAELEAVLFVPAHAVKREKGKDYCWLGEGDRVFLGTPEAYRIGGAEEE
jgi:HlyD family secretion protein